MKVLERIFTRRHSFLALYVQFALFALTFVAQRLWLHGVLASELYKPFFYLASYSILALSPFTVWSLLLSLGSRIYMENAHFGPRILQEIDNNTPFAWVLWPEVKQSFRERWGNTTVSREQE